MYIINLLLDLCAIPVLLVAMGWFGFIMIKAVLFYFERRKDYLFDLEMKQQHLEQTKVRTEVLKRETSLVQFDPLKPILARELLETGQYDLSMLMLAAKQLENMQPVQPVPNSISYAPHITYKNEQKQLESAAPVMLPVNPLGDFMQLFKQGLLPKDSFLLGQDIETGETVTANWRSFYSTLIGGASGSGKSTLVRSILAQATLQGSQFMVIDPHFGAGEDSLGESLKPLQSRMLTAVAYTDNQMIATLKNVSDIGKKRLAGEDHNKTPVVLIVDETTGLLQRGVIKDQLIETLAFISQETRKVGVYAIAIGQMFTTKVMPSEVRNCFVSFISCRTRASNARYMTDNSDFGDIASELTIGQAVWMNPSGDVTKLQVPNCTHDHLEAIANDSGVFEVLEGSKKNLPTLENKPSNDVENDESGRFREGFGKVSGRLNQDPETVRIIELFCNGSEIPDIVFDVFQVDSTSGRRYVDARNKITNIIRDYTNELRSK